MKNISDTVHPSYQLITHDGGIVKTTIVQPTDQNQKRITWRKGINAKIHYVVSTAPYKLPQESDTPIDAKDVIDPSTHQQDHPCCNHHITGPLNSTQFSVWQHAPIVTSPSGITYAYNPGHVPHILADSINCDNDPFDLRIGRQFAFVALEKAVRSMRVGETAKFLVFPEYTQGFIQFESQLRRMRAAVIAKKNNLPIPSNCCMGQFKDHHADNDTNKDLYDCADSLLEVQVSLLSVETPDKDFMPDAWELSLEDKSNRIPSLKDAASQHFSANEHEKARRVYSKALEYLKSVQFHFANACNSNQPPGNSNQTPPNVTDINCLQKSWISSTLLSLQSNIALCSLKLGHYQACITQCTQILDTNPDNVKARFRRALAHTRRGRDLELAKSDLEWVVALKTTMSRLDSEWANAWLELDTKIKAAKQVERALWHNAFDAKNA